MTAPLFIVTNIFSVSMQHFVDVIIHAKLCVCQICSGRNSCNSLPIGTDTLRDIHDIAKYRLMAEKHAVTWSDDDDDVDVDDDGNDDDWWMYASGSEQNGARSFRFTVDLAVPIGQLFR
jgi:hypothetical protein